MEEVIFVDVFIHDKLLVVGIIICVFVLMLVMFFIITLQRNKKKWEKKLSELSEILRQKEFALQTSQDSNKKSEKYISIISREIKEPFNKFAGLSEVLLDEFDFLSNDEKINYIIQLNEGVNTSINKIQNIFHWINYKSGNYGLNQQQIQVSDCLQENIKSILSYAQRRKIFFETDIEPGLQTFADLQMLNTIIRNLLYNAVDANPVDSKIVIKAFNTVGTIKLSVQDFGPGVRKAVKTKVFSKNLHKFSKEIENDYPSGLGLLLVKEFVMRIGGDLWLDSEINRGSKFTFTLTQAETTSNDKDSV
jgi:K+-sensing histidine kinase KdpD